MKSPGVEVRPLRQMTSESEFKRVFFRDVHIRLKILGKVNDGWSVCNEHADVRAGFVRRSSAPYLQAFHHRLIELSRTIQRNGRPAAEDPLIRQKLAQCSAEIEIMRSNQMRAFSRITATGVPGPEGSIQKIFWSELNQRLQQIAQELLGSYGQLLAGDSHAVDNGIWSYAYLRTRGIRSKPALPKLHVHHSISSGPRRNVDECRCNFGSAGFDRISAGSQIGV